MSTKIFSKAALAGVAIMAAQSVSAAVLDFAAEAIVNGERGVANGSSAAVLEDMLGSGFDVRLSATDVLSKTDGSAYLDRPAFGGKLGGLGVCTRLNSSDKCRPSDDDNVSIGEAVFIEIGADAGPGFVAESGTLNSGLFRNAVHELFVGDLEFSLNGGSDWDTATIGASGTYDFGGVSYTSAGLGFRFAGKDFYVSSLNVVPVPAAGLLLLGGIGALGVAGRRRRKKAA